MPFSKLFTLVVSASAVATAFVLGQGHLKSLGKRSEGTVVGVETGTSYFWNFTGTIAQCPTLFAPELQSSLDQFDGLFPREYDAGPFVAGQTVFNIGALYLSYPEGTYAFDLQYTSVTPNTTATWVNSGDDISNVWEAVREGAVNLWAQGTTWQFGFFDVTKTVNGSSNYAGQFSLQVQVPSFVRGCDTSCGGDCDPNICSC